MTTESLAQVDTVPVLQENSANSRTNEKPTLTTECSYTCEWNGRRYRPWASIDEMHAAGFYI